MKPRLTITICMVLLSFYAVSVQAQRAQKRSTLFASFPNTISCSEAQLKALFAAAKGQQISLPLAGNITLAGPVQSNLVKYSNLQTVVIKLPSYSNTMLSISKQMEGNSIQYVGRIFSPSSGDGFELKRTAKGEYQFEKIDLNNISNECTQ